MGMTRLDAGQMSTSVHHFPSLTTQEQEQHPDQRMVVAGATDDGRDEGQAVMWRLYDSLNDDFQARATQRGSTAVLMASSTRPEMDHAPVAILWIIYLNSDYYTTVFAHGLVYVSTLNVSHSCYQGFEIARDEANNAKNINSSNLSFHSRDDGSSNGNADSSSGSLLEDEGARRVNEPANHDPENTSVDGTTALLEGHDELTRRRRRTTIINNNAIIINNNNHNITSPPRASSASSLKTVILNLETTHTFASSNLRFHTVNSQGQVSTDDFDPFEFDDCRWDSKEDDDHDHNKDDDDDLEGLFYVDDNLDGALDTEEVVDFFDDLDLFDGSSPENDDQDDFHFDI